MDAGAGAGTGLGEALAEAADMHLGAAPLQEAAVKRLRAGLGGGVGAVEQRDVGVDLAGDQLAVALQALDMPRLRRELDPAGALEGAVDRLLAHDALDGVDGGGEGAVQRLRLIEAALGGDGDEAVRQAVADMAAVAPRCLGGDAASLEQHRPDAAPCQRQRGGEPGEAAADDRDIRASFEGLSRGVREGRRGVEPVGLELHAGCRASSIPNTPASPPMSLISVYS
jgi:hypothetical protein